jgi:hypothetical protein
VQNWKKQGAAEQTCIEQVYHMVVGTNLEITNCKHQQVSCKNLQRLQYDYSIVSCKSLSLVRLLGIPVLVKNELVLVMEYKLRVNVCGAFYFAFETSTFVLSFGCCIIFNAKLFALFNFFYCSYV